MRAELLKDALENPMKEEVLSTGDTEDIGRDEGKAERKIAKEKVTPQDLPLVNVVNKGKS